MANIKLQDISNLNLSGSELFEDPESFMMELSEDEDEKVVGGLPVYCLRPTCLDTGGVCPRSASIIVYNH